MKESAFVFALSPSNGTLLGRRSMDTDHAGKWDFFGGNLEKGEKPEDCAIREFQEETGIRLTAKLGPTFIIKMKTRKGKDRIVHVFCYYSLDETAKIKLNNEHSAFEWVDQDAQIYDYPLTRTAMIIMGTVIEASKDMAGLNTGQDTVFFVSADLNF